MSKALATKQNKKIYFSLWLLCLGGAWSVIPYILYLGIIPPSTPIWNLILLGTLQTAPLYGFICYFSYKLVLKTDLQPFPSKVDFLHAFLAGITVGMIIYLLDNTIFKTSTLATGTIHPPVWASVLASFYGGINEEVLLRLCLFTFIYFCLAKILKGKLPHFWVTNLLVAIVFGLGHLPAAVKLTTPSSLEISRILLLNAIPGLVFGWLYWSKGLWTAMTAHFVADLMIHVVF